MMSDEYTKARDSKAYLLCQPMLRNMVSRGFALENCKAMADWAHEFSTKHHKLYEDYEHRLGLARGLLLKYKDVYRTHQHTKFKNDGSHLQADIAMNELLAEIEGWLADQ